MQSVIGQLQDKNLVNVDHVNLLLEEFGENNSLISRLFNRTTGKSTPKQYSAEI